MVHRNLTPGGYIPVLPTVIHSVGGYLLLYRLLSYCDLKIIDGSSVDDMQF